MSASCLQEADGPMLSSGNPCSGGCTLANGEACESLCPYSVSMHVIRNITYGIVDLKSNWGNIPVDALMHLPE
jgi:hypothetical protein